MNTGLMLTKENIDMFSNILLAVIIIVGGVIVLRKIKRQRELEGKKPSLAETKISAVLSKISVRSRELSGKAWERTKAYGRELKRAWDEDDSLKKKKK